MTHDPQLVETVARAIHAHELGAALWHWGELSDLDRDAYRAMARAALDAVPKPIGYTIVVNEDGELARDLDYWSDDLAANIAEAKTLDDYWARPGHTRWRTHVVVALTTVAQP